MHFLTDDHLIEEQWYLVFLVSKPFVGMHVCCSYMELPQSKLQVGN